MITIKDLSNQALSDNEVNIFSRGLKFIPTAPVPSSYRSLIKDFNQFVRTTVNDLINVRGVWQILVALREALNR